MAEASSAERDAVDGWRLDVAIGFADGVDFDQGMSLHFANARYDQI